MTARNAFKESDVARALRAAQRCGLHIAGYRITPEGDISVQTGHPEAEKPQSVFAKMVEDGVLRNAHRPKIAARR